MNTPEQQQRARRIPMPRRWWTRLVVAAVVLAAVAAPAAWANHQFSDVPAASPHHNDISTIATAGITGGCAPSLYCPGDPVRRDQMASFLQRGLGRGAIFQASETVTATAPPDQVIGQLSLAVPGNGLVLVNASTDYGITGGSCNVIQRLIRPTSGDASWYSGTGTNATGDTGLSSTLLSPVTSGAGTRIFELHARKFSGACTASAFVDMNAIWVPFGASGGGVTSASSSSGQGQTHIPAGTPTGDPEK